MLLRLVVPFKHKTHMKKLFIAISLLSCVLFSKAQSDTTRIILILSFKDIQNIVNGLQELKIKDGMNTYLSVTNQTQAQMFKLKEAVIPKQDSISNKEKPTVKK
jgi:hypothetical protein